MSSELYYVTRHDGRSTSRPRRVVFVGERAEAKERFGAIVPRTPIFYSETVLWQGPPSVGYAVWPEGAAPETAEQMSVIGEDEALDAYDRRRSRRAKAAGLRVAVEPERIRVVVEPELEAPADELEEEESTIEPLRARR